MTAAKDLSENYRLSSEDDAEFAAGAFSDGDEIRATYHLARAQVWATLSLAAVVSQVADRYPGGAK